MFGPMTVMLRRHGDDLDGFVIVLPEKFRGKRVLRDEGKILGRGSCKESGHEEDSPGFYCVIRYVGIRLSDYLMC